MQICLRMPAFAIEAERAVRVSSWYTHGDGRVESIMACYKTIIDHHAGGMMPRVV